MKARHLLATILPLLGSALSGGAAQVWFSSSIEGGHLTSTGVPLGGDTVIELGAFTPGFTPTPENIAQWRENWHGAGRSLYDEENGWYSGISDIPGNSGPFATGRQGWMWVYNRSGEWSLFSNPAWTWPSVEGDTAAQALPVEWPLAQATQVVLGSVPAGETELATAQVEGATPPALGYGEWAELVFGGSPASTSGPQADADGDGVSNFAEYAFGSRADRAGSVPASGQLIHTTAEGARHLAVGIDKGWTTGVAFTAQLSEDLVTWYEEAPQVETLVDNTSRYLARDAQPLGARKATFMRLSATPAE